MEPGLKRHTFDRKNQRRLRSENVQSAEGRAKGIRVVFGRKLQNCVTGSNASEPVMSESWEISVTHRRSQDKLTWRKGFVYSVPLNLIVIIDWNGDVIPQTMLAASIRTALT